MVTEQRLGVLLGVGREGTLAATNRVSHYTLDVTLVAEIEDKETARPENTMDLSQRRFGVTQMVEDANHQRCVDCRIGKRQVFGTCLVVFNLVAESGAGRGAQVGSRLD